MVLIWGTKSVRLFGVMFWSRESVSLTRLWGVSTYVIWSGYGDGRVRVPMCSTGEDVREAWDVIPYAITIIFSEGQRSCLVSYLENWVVNVTFTSRITTRKVNTSIWLRRFYVKITIYSSPFCHTVYNTSTLTRIHIHKHSTEISGNRWGL